MNATTVKILGVLYECPQAHRLDALAVAIRAAVDSGMLEGYRQERNRNEGVVRAMAVAFGTEG